MPEARERKILLDENVNQRLLSLFEADLLVATVSAQGWRGLSNGELLREAADSFDNDDLDSDYPERTTFYRDHVIMWAKDLLRSVDYLDEYSDVIGR